MTSLKSLQNNFGYAFKTGLRDNSVVGVVCAVFLAIFYCFMPYMAFRNTSGKPKFAFLLTSEMQFMRYFVIVGLLGFGILMGIIAFKFITGKKTVNVYYSLGIKRTHLFTAKFLSGAAILALSVLLPLLICFILNVATLGFNKYLMVAIVYNFLGLFAIAFSAYSITALVFSTVGTAFEGVLFSGIVVLFPEIFFMCATALVSKLVVGTPYGENFSMYTNNSGVYSLSFSQRFAYLNPLRFFSEGIYTYASATDKAELASYTSDKTVAWSNPNFLPVICWMLVSVAIFALAIFAYERRKAEIGGFIGKNKVLNFIGTFVISFFIFTNVATYPSEKLSQTVMFLIGLAVFAVVSILLYIVLLRNMKLFKKNLINLPIQLVIVALIYVFFFTGYLGNAYKVPDTADISYAELSSATQNLSVESDGLTSYSFYNEVNLTRGTHPLGKYESEKDINYVRDVHQALAEVGKRTATIYNDDFNGVYPVSVQIKYVMKDGSTIYRNYYGITDEILQKLNSADNTDYRTAKLKDLFYGAYDADAKPSQNDYSKEAFDKYYANMYKKHLQSADTSAYIFNNVLKNGTELELTAQQMQQLRDCIYKDLTTITLSDMYTPSTTLGAIKFCSVSGAEQPSNEDGEVQTYTSNGSYIKSDSLSGEEAYSPDDLYANGSEWLSNQRVPTFLLSDKMTNTIDFLKTVGYYDELTSATQIKSVNLLPVKAFYAPNTYSARNSTSQIASKYSLGCEFVATLINEEDFVKNMYPNSYSVKDSADITSIVGSGVLRAVVSPNDYYAFVTLSDSTCITMYVKAENIPESIKTAAASATVSDY